jgi:GNAT superfamily N-acetyltransferase
MAYLATPWRGATGCRLLATYYRAVAHGRGAAGYVACDGAQVLGFICGVWDAAGLRREWLQTQWPMLLLWAPLSILRSPRLLGDWRRRLKDGTNGADSSSTTGSDGYELRPIVVDPTMRGTGTAARLVAHLEEDAQRRGFTTMHLYTEVENHAARTFYDKVGFVMENPVARGSVSYLRFAKHLVTVQT